MGKIYLIIVLLFLSCNNNNQIDINGTIKGDMIINPKISIIKDIENTFIKSSIKLNNYNLYITTRYKDAIKNKLSFEVMDTNIYKIHQNILPFDVIEYNIKNKGIKSINRYLSISEINPYKINGIFNLSTLENGILIEFI